MFLDLHIHSKYARWCSNKLTIENIWKTCVYKWIDIIWTGDFTHPKWFEEITYFLEEDWNGFLIPKNEFLNKWKKELYIMWIKVNNIPRFVLQTEINNIFTRTWKNYRIHNCILTNSITEAKKITDYLSRYWKIESDWRLWVKQDQIETLYTLKNNFNIIFFPAHIWTPYFGTLWDRWFDTIYEAYWNYYNLIDALETWLSSDPIMNWVNSELDNFSIISCSDAHSLENIWRECIYIDWFTNFWELRDILKYKKNNYKFSIEFYPQEWKYFADWHSDCNIIFTPIETIKNNYICPICWKKLTIWVFNRTLKLWDKNRFSMLNYWSKFFYSNDEIEKISKLFNRPYFLYSTSLWNILKDVYWYNKWTKNAEKKYFKLVSFYPEIYLMNLVDINELKKIDPKLANTIEKLRKWDIIIKSWYDWKYWEIIISKNSQNLFF